MLQRGRRANAAESGTDSPPWASRSSRFNGAAARTRRRGSERHDDRVSAHRASTGPPRERGGEPAATQHALRDDFRFNGAAARTRRRAGTGFPVPPDRHASTGPPRERGGEYRNTSTPPPGRCLLQRGRRANAAERSRGPAARRRCAGFNGAAARTRRRGWRLTRAATARRRFNGAAARTRRRVVITTR